MFEVSYKEETLEGYMYLEEADDEAPLRFYDKVGNEQWNVPEVPYPNPLNLYQQERNWDYEHLTYIFHTSNIIQYLVDFADEHKEIILHENENTGNHVILVIN